MAWWHALHAVDGLPVRAGYLTFALAALGLLLVGTLAGLPGPRAGSLAVMLGLDGGDAPELVRRRARDGARRTASCMRSLGFTYDPIPEPSVSVPDPGLDPIAWAQRWGFGVTTSLGTWPSAEQADRNAARAERLPAGAQERYARALHGDGTVPGCHGVATAAVYGLRERALAPLRPHLVELDWAVDADAGMDRVRATWADCAGAAIMPLVAPTIAPDRERLPAMLLGWFAQRLGATRSAREMANAQALERWVALGIARCEAAFARGRAAVATPHEAAFLRLHGAAVSRVGAAIRAAEGRLASLPPRDSTSGR